MAHFFRPAAEPASDYDLDTKIAPDAVWRMRIPCGETRRIGLWGGNDLFIKSNNPNVVPNGIFGRESGDVVTLTLEGKGPGTSMVETFAGPAKSVVLQVQVTGAEKCLVPPAASTKPYQPAAAEDFAAAFADGLMKGLSGRLDPALAAQLVERISNNKLDFYQGYVSGILSGLASGLVELAKLCATVAQISIAFMPQNVLKAALTEGYLLLTDRTKSTVYALKEKAERAALAAEIVAELIRDIDSRPTLYIAKSQASGAKIGMALADQVNASVANSSSGEAGKFFGKFVGRVLFEIIVFVALTAVSGGGGGARAGVAVGEIAQESGNAGRFVRALVEMLEEIPAIKRLVQEVIQSRSAARGGALTEAEIDAALSRMKPAGDLIELGPHGAATQNRRALGVSGQDVQSAHGMPQAVGRGVGTYNADHALTRLMSKASHASMDLYWKQQFQAMRRAGRTEATAQEIFDVVSESVRRAQGISQGEKASLIARLSDEMFVEYGLQPGQRLPLPYPNIKP